MNSLLYMTGASLFPWLDSWMPLQELLLDQDTVLGVSSISTVFLWAQEVVTSGRAKLYKKPTADILADPFTKPLEAQRMLMLLSQMGYSFVEGRHHLALDI